MLHHGAVVVSGSAEDVLTAERLGEIGRHVLERGADPRAHHPAAALGAVRPLREHDVEVDMETWTHGNLDTHSSCVSAVLPDRAPTAGTVLPAPAP